jgi:orotate phosphoribosyltransferase
MISFEELKRKLISKLRLKSFKYSDDPPFILASGKESFFYFNCKPTYLDPEGMELIGRMIFEKLRGWRINAIGGLELGAIPPCFAATVISQIEGEPISTFIVRKDKKDHGDISAIEGDVEPGQKVAIFDDVITTGASTIKAIEAAKAKGLDIVMVIVIVDRQEGGREAIQEALPGVEIVALVLRDEVMTEDQRIKAGLSKK